MIGVVLAAGVASRLRPLTETVPKCLLPLGSRPLLGHVLFSLWEAGLSRCVIVTGYRAPQIQTFVDSLALPLPVTCLHNPRYEETNNNYSLWLAGEYARGDSMLMLDGDILFAPQILRDLLREPAGNALAVRSRGHVGTEDVKVQCDAQGCVVRIGKEIDPAVAAGESIGIEKFDRTTTLALFDVLERRREGFEFYEASFQEIINGGACIRTVDTGAHPCMEIDTIEDYRAACALAERTGI